MEKLELKHLNPYLPYKLRVLRTERNSIGTLEGITTNTLGQEFAVQVSGTWINPYIKPLLIPLINLTNDNNSKVNTKLLNILNEKHGMYIDLLNGKIKFKFKNEYLSNMNNVLECYQELLKEHIDVFGLIEKGLALDINTL